MKAVGWIDLSVEGVRLQKLVLRGNQRVFPGKKPPHDSLRGLVSFKQGKRSALTIRKSIVPQPKVKKLGEKAYVKQVGDRVLVTFLLL